MPLSLDVDHFLVTAVAATLTQRLHPISGSCVLLVYADRLIYSLIVLPLSQQTDLEVIWCLLQLHSLTLWRLPLTPVYRTHPAYSISLIFLQGEATLLAHRTSKATGCNCIKWI